MRIIYKFIIVISSTELSLDNFLPFSDGHCEKKAEDTTQGRRMYPKVRW